MQKNHINPIFQRLVLLTGKEALSEFQAANVIIFGLGGVGGWCAEALVRSGIGNLSIVDFDRVCATNINRQIQATSATVGQFKAETLKRRLLEINPDCNITVFNNSFSESNADIFGINRVDYVIDAIDSINDKLDLIEKTSALGIKLFSSMGMARKLDPTQIKTADIWETHGCPLARLVRSGLRKRGFTGNFTAVFSAEVLDAEYEINDEKRSHFSEEDCEQHGAKKVINGSAVTVTASAGMILASLVLRSICGRNIQRQSK